MNPHTRFFVLEDAKLIFRSIPPPTAKMDYRSYLIFGMHAQLVHTCAPTEAFLVTGYATL